jgi:asparagine synthase (glutamine-hydrolysing)
MLQRMMHLDLKSALADNDIRKNTRMCALAGLEVRFPFMDDDLVAFAATIPSHMLLPGTQLRRFFKDAMAGFLPAEIIAKEKHGFGLPFAQWIKGDPALRDAVSDLLAAVAKRQFFNPAFLEAVKAAPHTAAATPYDGFAWDIAILELWMEKHIDL